MLRRSHVNAQYSVTRHCQDKCYIITNKWYSFFNITPFTRRQLKDTFIQICNVKFIWIWDFVVLFKHGLLHGYNRRQFTNLLCGVSNFYLITFVRNGVQRSSIIYLGTGRGMIFRTKIALASHFRCFHMMYVYMQNNHCFHPNFRWPLFSIAANSKNRL